MRLEWAAFSSLGGGNMYRILKSLMDSAGVWQPSNECSRAMQHFAPTLPQWPAPHPDVLRHYHRQTPLHLASRRYPAT